MESNVAPSAIILHICVIKSVIDDSDNENKQGTPIINRLKLKQAF